MQKSVLNFIKHFRLRVFGDLKHTCVDAVLSHHVGWTVMIQVVDKFFRIESARTHARQKEDEHQ